MSPSSAARPGVSARVRAPELAGRGWLNTAGPVRLRDLRGRFVLLDFWTFCCINCLHVLDELRPVEEAYADELVMVGVHSPKFVHEADPQALAAAVERYEVHHPVLDDPDLTTWQAYAARAWPTLVLVDPEGYVVAHYAGEGHAHAIGALLAELVAEHRERGTLQPGDSPYVAPEPGETDLRFPAKAVALPDGHLLVADAGRHALVELGGARVVRRIGDGVRGLVDGTSPRFSEPNGLCLLPPEVAAEVGYDLVVADTVNHALRGVVLATGETRTLAGDGHPWFQGDPAPRSAPGPVVEEGEERARLETSTRLSSPWDVAWWQERVWVAMAGIHQLWTFDPRTGDVAAAAGTTNEGLVDGPLADAWFAQPSGLVPDGDRLWLADAETSALRFVADGAVTTVVGHGLFDFGFRDGDRETARLQHPLGVGLLPDGAVAVTDTYNGAVRRFDPATGLLSTLASGLEEPSGVVVAGGRLHVVESAAHTVTEVDPAAAAGAHEEFAAATQRPTTDVAAGLVLDVTFTPPPGQKVDERFGPATQLLVSATPAALIKEGDGRTTDLRRTLVLDPAVGDGVLHVAARAASCDAVGGEGAACRMHQQDWGVPVRVTTEGEAHLVLPLGGMDVAEDAP
ncbi:redoxin domain-containing protein [Nocardioides guangzhouensis]|uniref:Redoxin domain-containing protein n=1 Tax=Nocardioides guangzhouensis TaxID=2497878 RepID=A0A4Q4ZBN8_9ACTN|nr:NHL domain-containing thioredoxin family protein [Nocardioides guangzhouensis]RYP85353.1 redoxin domain-containing protein [Nocardioides guangzhouensis]